MLARPDTRFLADSASITTDDSQYLTDITPSGSGGYESPSARGAITGDGAGRALEVSAEIDAASAGVLLDHGGDLGPALYRIEIDGGEVDFQHAGASIGTLSAPNVDGALGPYIVAWSTEPNPATTGPADALRSEILVYDVDGDELAWSVVTHTQVTANPAGALGVGGRYNGITLTSAYSDTINVVRVSARFHTRTETREHLVAQTAAPTIEGTTACEAPLEPAAACEAGALAGPQYQAAAASMAIGRNRHRLAGPVLQLVTREPLVFGADLSTTISPTWVHVDADGFGVPLGWLWRRRVPRHLDLLLGFAQWATWYTAGASVDVDLKIACGNGPAALATSVSSAVLNRTTHDGVEGLGVLERWRGLRVRRDVDGWSWIWVGLRVNVEAPTVNAAFLRSLSVCPYTKPAAGPLPPFEFGA